jgi:hypothetical protein
VNIAGTALYPLPDLSAHCVIPVVAFDVMVDVSAASSHRLHPGIVGEPSPEFKVEIICAPVGKKIEGWLVMKVLEITGGGEGNAENTGTTDGTEYESGSPHFLER